MKPCCDVAVEVMTALGAEHAARMHRGRAARAPASWSDHDWEMHMREEEEVFIPLVARLNRHAARMMWRDHAAFRRELARYGEIRSLERMAAHSAAEDLFAEEMVARGMVIIKR